MKHAKHQNQIRIIGGSCRGRRLSFQNADGLRPTPDSVRERLFNWLGQDLTGRAVLDLFAGSGALGLEAASRNAASVVLVENNRRTLQTVEGNIRDLGLKQVETLCSDGLFYLKHCSRMFDTVFLDPPFNWRQWPDLFVLLQGRLNIGATVYIEAGSLPQFPDRFVPYREGRAGMSRFALLAYEGGD